MADHTTPDDLVLIKDEITASLAVVHGLIATADGPPEPAASADAVRALEQVGGALQFLRLLTTARLVEEMAQLLEQIGGAEPAAGALARQTLKQALTQLEEHLERLADGGDEPPLTLWPIIDEVRAASRRMPLTHSELLILASSGLGSDSQWMPEELECLSEIMRQTRPQFHRYLLKWYRQDPARDGLARMISLFHNLAQQLGEGLLADLFRLVELLCTALNDGLLAASAATRALPGRVDWVMKPLAQPSPEWPEFEALTLIRQIIDVLDAAGIEREELTRFRAIYLADVPAQQAKPARAASPELAAIAADALDEIATIKVLYDRIGRDNHADPSVQTQFDNVLRNLAERLEPSDGVDFGTLPERIRSIADDMQTLAPEDMRPNSPRLLSCAIEILGVEGALQACAVQHIPETDDARITDLDIRELITLTLREAQFEIGRVHALIERWHNDDSGEQVATLADHLQSIVGALQMIDEQRVAQIGHLLHDVIQRGFLAPGHQPDAEQFAMLADATAALEMSIERLLGSHSGHEDLLEQADRVLDQLFTELALTRPETQPEDAPPANPVSAAPDFVPSPPEANQAAPAPPLPEPDEAPDSVPPEIAPPPPNADDDLTAARPARQIEREDPQLVQQRLDASLPGATHGRQRALSSLVPDPELLGVFYDEARELLDQLEAQFRQWRAGTDNIAALEALKRTLHTLKGSARLAGVGVIGDLAHALETHLTDLPAHASPDTDTRSMLRQALEILSAQLNALQQGEALPPIDRLSGHQTQNGSLAHETIQDASGTAQRSPAPSAQASGSERQGATATTRVPAEQLNHLMDQAGEIGIGTTHLTRCTEQQAAVLDEFKTTATQLRTLLYQLEGETERLTATTTPDASDPHHRQAINRCTDEIATALDDLQSTRKVLAEQHQDMLHLLGKQSRLGRDLHTGLLNIRLAPFAQIVPKLHRLVRRVASELGKSARLEVIGQEIELDRILLERLVAPLEHLLRNAVAHGLEDPRRRAEQGKPIVGTICLHLRRDGNDVAIDVRDDGCGLDTPAIVAKAHEHRLPVPDGDLTAENLLPLLLEPGFSTAAHSTQISGRGVGLDVVASDLRDGGGRIALESEPGQGACFTIHLPLDLVLISAFLVMIGDIPCVVPHNAIEGIGRIAREDLLAIRRGEERTFISRGEPYEIAYLGCLLDPGSASRIGPRRWQPLLLARLGERRVAIHVDQLLDSRRVLIKPFGQQLSESPWLSGGSVLNDGQVALVVDLQALADPHTEPAGPPAGRHSGGDLLGRPCVMVVDDSLTARHITSHWLKRCHIEVIQARDGVEALMLLDERIPDLLLLDLEMPRMGGLELMRQIRASSRLQDLPIVIISSRTDPEHRQRALDLGAKRFLKKPLQEHDLSALMAENLG